ncbi:hypothetical protein NQZ68_035929 [Dissostichus eleginoides]|nr:hypothetical protein NQZ68_035929 [Dissostichus eleginoides]
MFRGRLNRRDKPGRGEDSPASAASMPGEEGGGRAARGANEEASGATERNGGRLICSPRRTACTANAGRQAAHLGSALLSVRRERRNQSRAAPPALSDHWWRANSI